MTIKDLMVKINDDLKRILQNYYVGVYVICSNKISNSLFAQDCFIFFVPILLQRGFV